MRDRRCDTATVRGEIHAEHTLKKKINKHRRTHTTSGRARWMFKWRCPAMDACELNVAAFTFTK